MDPLELSDLEKKSLEELKEIGQSLGIENGFNKRQDLVISILKAFAESSGLIFDQGVLEILPDGWGFLRHSNFAPSPSDVYVSQSQIKRFGLKTGDTVSGQVRPPKDTEKYYSLLRVQAVNNQNPEVARTRKSFDDLTPIYPNEQLILETGPEAMSARFIDLIAPIGKGQRGLIVAAPKAGKTTLLKTIANSVTKNHPEVVLIVLLIDERPEEVTDIRRSVDGQVVSSTFDELPENHMRVADMVLEMSKRLVESGKDVAGQHHAPVARVDPDGYAEWTNSLGWSGPERALPAEAVHRRRAQYRGGRQPYGDRHRACRNRQQNGRCDL